MAADPPFDVTTAANHQLAEDQDRRREALPVVIEVGRVLEAEPFEEARKPKLAKLRIDLGDRVVQSAAQVLYHHSCEELVGRLVLCATNLGTVRIAGFKSEALTVGVPGEDGTPVLVHPAEDVPLGGKLY